MNINHLYPEMHTGLTKRPTLLDHPVVSSVSDLTGVLWFILFVRFRFVFDLLFNLFKTALWPSVGKELTPWLFTCVVLSLF